MKMDWLPLPEKIAVGRIPRLPAEIAYALLEAEDPLAAARAFLDDPRIVTALYVSSPSLAGAAQQWAKGGKPKNPRTPSKVLSYLLRMATRCTPYGLLSSISMINLGSETSLAVSGSSELKARTRPDMAWLMEFVRRVEKNPEFLDQLIVRPNTLIIERAGRLFVTSPDKHGYVKDGGFVSIQYAPISLKKTTAIQFILERLVKDCTIGGLTEDLVEKFGATREESRALLLRLLDAGLFVTNLRPAPIGDPLPQVIESLPPTAVDEREALLAVMHEIKNLDKLSVDTLTVSDVQRVEKRMSAMVSDIAPFQMDLAHEFSGTLSEQICREAAFLVEIWSRSCFRHGLRDYRERFNKKYAVDDIRVPLLELTDAHFGLGEPVVPEAIETMERTRTSALMRLATESYAAGAIEVLLEPADLEPLLGPPRSANQVLSSLEIGFTIESESLSAVRAGNYRIVPAGLPATHEATRSIGRFGHLLDDESLGRLRKRATRLSGDSTKVHAELVYQPAQDRFSNVSLRPQVYDKEIRIGVTGRAGDEGATGIPLSDILVGIRDGYFTLWERTSGREVHVHESHMLNPSVSAPTACRFLIEQSRDGKVFPMGFNWGEAASLPFLPRLRVGNLVISRARWNIERQRLGRDLETARAEIRRYQHAFGLPNHVTLMDSDQRLPLNLSSDHFVRLLLEQLPSNEEFIVLEEFQEPDSTAWLRGPDGSYFSEILVSIEPAVSPNSSVTVLPASQAPRPISEVANRTFGPGSKWAYAKIYCGQQHIDTVLRTSISPLVRGAVDANSIDRWFYLRYQDPLPHIRLRLHSNGAPILAELAATLESWMADGLIETYAFDTYAREIERYGGEDCYDEIERLFSYDSDACLEQLEQRLDDPRDRMLATISGIAVYIDGFYEGGIDEWLSTHSRPSRKLEAGEWELVRASQERITESRIIPESIVRVRDLLRKGSLTIGREPLLDSLIHMRCNRMGVQYLEERKVLDVLWHSYNGLQKRRSAALS